MTPSILLLLLSPPLLGLWFLALVVLTLSTIYAADPPWKRSEARQKERDDGTVHVVEANHAVAFGLVASCGLLTVWLWPDILVYVSLILFGIGSFYGMQQCLMAIVRSAPSWRIPGSGGVTETIVAAATVLWWAVVRNTAQAWIWQDILGAFTITLVLRTLKLPSLRVSCLLLTSAFIYDIFWVFISSRFTSTGESVMEAAATGSGVTVKETVPMMFRVPVYWAEDSDAYTMLGFGDLVLPGLVVTLCREADGWVGITPGGRAYAGMAPSTTSIFDYLSNLYISFRWTYHRAAIAGYGAGLQMTFIAMLLTEIGQPALLYLAPCTLFPVIYLSWRRGQLEMMWTGDFETDGKEADEDGGMVGEDGPEEVIEVETSQ